MPSRAHPRWSCALLLLFARTAFATDLVVDVTDAQGRPLPGAALYAEPVDGDVPRPTGAMRATIDQVKKEFIPQLSVVRTGTTVAFPNSDNIRHSIYSFSPAKTFETKLYSGREAAPVVFDKPGLVVLGCNIHDQMAAWVIVVDTPWFATTDKAGAGTLKSLPPGDYKVSAWFPAPTFAPVVATVRVGEGPPLRLPIRLDAEPLAAGHDHSG